MWRKRDYPLAHYLLIDTQFKMPLLFRSACWQWFLVFQFALGGAAALATAESPDKLVVVEKNKPHLRQLVVAQPPDDGQLVLKGPLPSFVKVWQAEDPQQQPLEFTFNTDATKITIHLPTKKAPTAKPVMLNFLCAEKTTACSGGQIVLSALDAQVIGKQAQLETHPGNHRIGFWTRAEDYVAWDVEIPAGEYRLDLTFSRATETGTEAAISFDQQSIPLKLEKTGSWYRYRIKQLGQLKLKESNGKKRRVEVRCKKIVNGGVMNLKALILTPIEAKASQQKAKLPEAASSSVSFNNDIRPLLSDRCYLCHGPDAEAREADLRLDHRESAIENAIVPGDWSSSEIIARITSDDPDMRMPPEASNKPPLTSSEIDLLKRWIDEGANYEDHWAFVPPQRPALPVVKHEKWKANPIDRFVLAQLETKGLQPAQQADRRTLLRRAAYDLTGLPPSDEQLRAFLADQSDEAWSKALDRLMALPAYGEHQARYWLDAARYADSNGYQYDFQRDQWAWRDWVINAFNENKPFSDFTIEQLAGDLLPNATDQQRLATGFNRNHPITVEGGVIDEEYRIEYVLDRTVTAGTVWLGMTVGCCRCHDHKYDPISQKEFYQLSGFFNQVPEKGMNGFAPQAKIASPYQQQALVAARNNLTEATTAFRSAFAAGKLDQSKIEKELAAHKQRSWQTLSPESAVSLGGAEMETLPDRSVLVKGKNPESDVYEVALKPEVAKVSGIQLVALTHESLPLAGVSRSSNANFVLSELEVEVASQAAPDKFKKIKLARAQADYSQAGYPIEKTIDGKTEGSGWAVDGNKQELRKARTAIFTPEQPIAIQAGDALRVRMRFNSRFANHQLGRFRLAVSEQPDLGKTQEIATLLEKPRDQRTDAELVKVEEFLADRFGSDPVKQALQRLELARAELKTTQENVPQTMIMQELPKPRPTYVLDRGEYDKRTLLVQPDTPSTLPAMPEHLPKNRLGFARWLTMPDHPLTSRVTVNRFWQQLFGVGLVDTPEDFGLQSSTPTHPELLDWLAVEFVESGWDLQALLKTIMTSQTYQQSSHISPEAHAIDPENRLLGRGPRMRLDAEMIRDSVLAVSGLLNQQVGGPSVFPYHPKGLWLEINNRPGFSSEYKQDTGHKLYRRSLYTYWKRTVPPPSMAVFDAPTREFCQVRRSRTNTPLQAFVLLHDPQYVEAARVLAEHMLREGGETLEQQIQFGFKRCLGRLPSAEEQAVLQTTYQAAFARYQQQPEQAEQLLSIGQASSDGSLPLSKRAAMTTVGRLLLNLSEFVTKG